MAVESATIDKRDNEFFTRKAEDWWAADGQFKHLRALGVYTLGYIEDRLLSKRWASKKSGEFKLTKKVKVLDAGCGGGFVSEPLARKGCTVVGIDVNESMIEIAKNHAKLDSSLVDLSYHLESIEEHSEKNEEQYDVVVLAFVLQHSINHDILISNCVKALKPGGIIILSAANRTVAGWFSVILLGDLVFGYVPRGSHNWRLFIKPEEVETYLSENKCTGSTPIGLHYDTATCTVIGTRRTGGYYIMHGDKN
ncbi:hypothetical protein RI129_011177 [Pyrocoelia pectoralis]|uniref:Methyltransferase type 11 domain-containing protein n=1 Tax=Pyrocoelia pectoralis TaxID=417401 RepID=A0AAN7V8E8_9COLE